MKLVIFHADHIAGARRVSIQQLACSAEFENKIAFAVIEGDPTVNTGHDTRCRPVLDCSENILYFFFGQ